MPFDPKPTPYKLSEMTVLEKQALEVVRSLTPRMKFYVRDGDDVITIQGLAEASRESPATLNAVQALRVLVEGRNGGVKEYYTIDKNEPNPERQRKYEERGTIKLHYIRGTGEVGIEGIRLAENLKRFGIDLSTARGHGAG